MDVIIQRQVALGIKKADDPEVVNRPKAEITKTIAKAYQKELNKKGISIDEILKSPVDTIVEAKKIVPKEKESLDKGFETNTTEFKDEGQLRKELKTFIKKVVEKKKEDAKKSNWKTEDFKKIQENQRKIQEVLNQIQESQRKTKEDLQQIQKDVKKPEKVIEPVKKKKYPPFSYEPIDPEKIDSTKPFMPKEYEDKNFEEAKQSQNELYKTNKQSNLSNMLDKY